MDNIAILVAHPDDVAYCMGGTLLTLRGLVKAHILCVTRGERGCPDWTMAETAAIREPEERAACKVLGAEVTFLDRIDAEVYADKDLCDQVAAELKLLEPVALFTLWGIDSHGDHSAVSEVARKVTGVGESECPIVYFEADMSSQTSQFSPDIYVDVTKVWDEKLRALRCHECQNTDDELVNFAIRQCTFRGWECGCKYAEGFKVSRPIKMEPADLLTHLAKTKSKYPQF